MKKDNNGKVIVDGKTYTKHMGLASDSYDSSGDQMTSILLLGDPLNLVGYDSKQVEILIPDSAIMRLDTREELEEMVSDEGIAKRKWALADGSHTKLDCMIQLATCIGPDCNKFAGIEYDKCPHSTILRYKK